MATRTPSNTTSDYTGSTSCVAARKYFMARDRRRGLSSKAPKPVLQRLHKRPLTAPELWSWSMFIRTVFPNSLRQIPHRPFWASIISFTSVCERPYRYLSRSATRISKILARFFLYRLFAFIRSRALANSRLLYLDCLDAIWRHSRQQLLMPSRLALYWPKASCGFLVRHLVQNRPSAVTRWNAIWSPRLIEEI